jgi:DNA-binding NtrC family response regulator
MSKQPRILIVEDDRDNARALERLMASWGYDAVTASSGHEAVERGRREAYDVVLTDIRMEGLDGLGVLKAFREMHPHTPVIVMTGFGSIDTAVTAMKSGAFNYVSKPFKPDEIQLTVERALALRASARDASAVPPAEDGREPPRLIGHSPAMAELYRTIALAAMGPSTILVQGESGTGKELVAHALHQNSRRAKASFVTVNCAALPEPLLESELFGYTKGAHSTATRDKPGLVESAAGGTLFLDEVADASLSIQAKLLRVLEASETRRLGDNRTIQTDVRILAATNKDLGAVVAEGRFRSDLYYRLNVVTINIPPLRNRKEDIPLLVEHFIHLYAARARKPVVDAAPEVLVRFEAHDWPGNVRELENVIERAVLLNTKTRITIEDLPESFGKPPSPPATFSLRQMEKRQIEQALQKTGGNVTAAADLLEIDRRTIYRKAAEYGIKLRQD